MLRIPAIFFNHAEVSRIGTETVFTASLIVNGREIEKCYMYFSKGAQEQLRSYLRVECPKIEVEKVVSNVEKTEGNNKILGQVKG